MILPLIALLAAWVAVPYAQADTSPRELYGVQAEFADRINAQLLDPILGPGKGHAFLSGSVEVAGSEKHDERTGYGEASNGKAVPKEGADRMQHQVSRQTKAETSTTRRMTLSMKELRVVIFHDEGVDAARLKAVRETLSTLFRDALKADAVEFHPIPNAPR